MNDDLENFRKLLTPPPWLISREELKARNIDLRPPVNVMKPGFVYRPDPRRGGMWRYVVKITEPSTEEVQIYEKLHQRSLASPNHTLPCQIIRPLDNPPFIIMPLLHELIFLGTWKWDLRTLLHHFSQILEGIEYLHQAHIAHLDVSVTNMLIAHDEESVKQYQGLEHKKIYIIDFNVSRQLDLGPGQQPAIELPGSQCPKPNGLTRLDPYSWDMYCVGMAFRNMVYHLYEKRSRPRLLVRYVDWIVGNERGCTSGVCRCRPDARTARRALATLQTIVEACG
ncbi:hypothetical protein C8Q76DRAFT_724134 [Earliella scabrosa]|nr:hypothetical protein C8Q76DRAFT_724134 [Earliella scabrosa]